MISFYPGPSQLNAHLEPYLKEALKVGILSQNHRSAAFMELYEQTLHAVRDQLNVPNTYSVYFVSSATECWEILSQDLGHLQNIHLYNGSFGEKRHGLSAAFHPSSTHALSFDENELPDLSNISPKQAEVIHLTQNETSNGTQIPEVVLQEIRSKYPEAFICVDATSSLGGPTLPIHHADIWFASVQKCLGLPSGMALLMCSPRVVEFAQEGTGLHYNSIKQQELQFKKRQTTHTPNILNIYLLNRVLRERKNGDDIPSQLEKQAHAWYVTFDRHERFEPLIQNMDCRSSTVITVTGGPDDILKLKQLCFKQDIIIGNGYGTYQNDTFRIANFPSHTTKAIKKLQNLIVNFS